MSKLNGFHDKSNTFHKIISHYTKRVLQMWNNSPTVCGLK